MSSWKALFLLHEATEFISVPKPMSQSRGRRGFDGMAHPLVEKTSAKMLQRGLLSATLILGAKPM